MANKKLINAQSGLLNRFASTPVETDAKEKETPKKKIVLPKVEDKEFEGFDVPTGYKIIPIELKSKQISAKITQSLYDEAKAKAEAMDMKFNAFIEYALKEAIKNGR